MVEPSARAGAYGIGIGLLSIGGILTLTVAGAVFGIPMMILGAIVVWKGRSGAFDDDPTVDTA